MKKYLIILLALSLLGAIALTGCSQDEESERPTLVMGTSAGFPPFEFIASAGNEVIGQYAGIDLRLVRRIAEELGYDIEVRDMAFGGLIASLQNREIDFIAAAMTIRPDRAEMVNFSVPYFDARQTIIINAGNTAITSVSDLEGKTVGVQFATTAELAMTDDDVPYDIDVVSFNQPAVAMVDLLNGTIDAVVVDAPVARGFQRVHGDAIVLLTDEDFFGPEQFGMAFNLADTELLARFNEVLTRLIAEGYVDELYDHYAAYFEAQN